MHRYAANILRDQIAYRYSDPAEIGRSFQYAGTGGNKARKGRTAPKHASPINLRFLEQLLEGCPNGSGHFFWPGSVELIKTLSENVLGQIKNCDQELTALQPDSQNISGSCV